MANKTILVTGGSGLVGRAIAVEVEQDMKLKADGYSFVFVSSKDSDLRSSEQCDRLFKLHRPSHVIHLAARVGGLFANMMHNDLFFSINSSINENVLGCCELYGVHKCISCLSTCIFPAQIEYPLDESKIHDGPPHQSNVGYSLAKRQVDLMNRELNKRNQNSLYTSIIPTNIFGRHDNFNLKDSHVVPGLIHKAYLSATAATAAGKTCCCLEVCGTGKPLRQFIYARDLARLILWALHSYEDPEPIIMSPGEEDEISIAQVAETVAEIMGKKLNCKIQVVCDNVGSDGQLKKTATNGKLKKLHPEFSFTPFRTALEDVIEWFCESYPNVRM